MKSAGFFSAFETLKVRIFTKQFWSNLSVKHVGKTLMNWMTGRPIMEGILGVF